MVTVGSFDFYQLTDIILKFRHVGPNQANGLKMSILLFVCLFNHDYRCVCVCVCVHRANFSGCL